MSRTYYFEFCGTKKDFLEILNQYDNNGNNHFFFDDYIVEVSDENYRFGVERGGHSGGYWYKPTVTEAENKLVFIGKIKYLDFYSNDKGLKKVINKTEECCICIILAPLILFAKVFTLLEMLIRKILRKPHVKAETTEDRLFYLMKDLLHCTYKE